MDEKAPGTDPEILRLLKELEDKREELKRLRERLSQLEREEGKKEIDEELIEGLDRRAFYLLKADDQEWSDLLDNLKFWRPGWKVD